MECLSQSRRGASACNYKLPWQGHTSTAPASPFCREFLFVVDILFTHQHRDFKYLCPSWNFSLHCLGNYLIELRHTISLPFQCKGRKWPGAFFTVIEMSIEMYLMTGVIPPSPERPIPSYNSSMPRQSSSSHVLGNIILVEDVDGFGHVFLSVPTCCFGTFLPAHGWIVEKTSF